MALMQTDRPAQKNDEYRGRILPDGMTPACFEELENLFVAFEREQFEGFASDAAIRAFVVAHSLRG